MVVKLELVAYELSLILKAVQPLQLDFMYKYALTERQACLLFQDVIQKETGCVKLDLNAAVDSPACPGFLLESGHIP